jgi:hypothetical protein
MKAEHQRELMKMTLQALQIHSTGMSELMCSCRQGGSTGVGRVNGRKRDRDGWVVGKANENPILDTRVHDVEFEDEKVGEYAANVIAEHMASVTNLEGNKIPLMEAIVAHRKDGHAVAKADVYAYSKDGRRSIHKTTKGWQLCVQLHDGSTTWERLADLKKSNLIEAAKYGKRTR